MTDGNDLFPRVPFPDHRCQKIKVMTDNHIRVQFPHCIFNRTAKYFPKLPQHLWCQILVACALIRHLVRHPRNCKWKCLCLIKYRIELHPIRKINLIFLVNSPDNRLFMSRFRPVFHKFCQIDTASRAVWFLCCNTQNLHSLLSLFFSSSFLLLSGKADTLPFHLHEINLLYHTLLDFCVVYQTFR